MADIVDLVEVLIGYHVDDRSFYDLAMNHSSFANEQLGSLGQEDALNGASSVGNNERLEFLGDAVLSLVISDKLMNLFPQLSEGVLSKYRSSIVSEPSLCSLAKSVGLGDYLHLGKGEESTQGRQKPSILADALEALIAAIFLSEGWDVCQNAVGKLFAERLAEIESEDSFYDYKSRLQELTQKKWNAIPQYRIVDISGPDHARVFNSEVLINEVVMGRGKASSKKMSEQRSAREALQSVSSQEE